MMNYTGNKIQHWYWPWQRTRVALILAVVLIWGFSVVFFQQMMPTLFLISSPLVIASFFVGLSEFSVRWGNLEPRRFYKRLFWTSLTLRLFFLLYVFLITYIYAPHALPLEFSAADAWNYDYLGKKLIGKIYGSQAISIIQSKFRSQADWGFPLYVGFWYDLFGKPVVVWIKLLNCLLGSMTVVLIGKITEKVFSFKHAFVAGLLAMLMPSLLWFGAMFLKETLMIFIVTYGFYQAVLVIYRRRISVWAAFIILLCAYLLLYFRTVLAVLFLVSVLVYFALNLFEDKRTRFTVTFLAIAILTGTYMLISNSPHYDSVWSQYESLPDYAEKAITSKIKSVGNIDIKKAAVFPLMIAASALTPFPSFLYVDQRQLGVIAHFPNEIVRNFIFFFFFLGAAWLLKNAFRRASLILFFALSYIILLAITGTSLFDRFQLPALPFVIIIMAVGLVDTPDIWQKKWNYYLLFISLAILAWNVFKLVIRGML